VNFLPEFIGWIDEKRGFLRAKKLKKKGLLR
jgi:hypothetical protein